MFFIKYFLFDEPYRYDKKNLKPQHFTYYPWNKKYNELFANPTDILDAGEPIFELNSILDI